jgi:hypothetical protein
MYGDSGITGAAAAARTAATVADAHQHGRLENQRMLHVKGTTHRGGRSAAAASAGDRLTVRRQHNCSACLV